MVENIASALGQEFKTAREHLGQDHAAISKDICVSASYLVAIEEGRFNDLPEQAFATGFIRSYAKSVQMDHDAAVEKYKNAMCPKQVEENPLVTAGGEPLTMEKMRGFNEAALAPYKAQQTPANDQHLPKAKSQLNYSLLGGFLAVVAIVATAGISLPS